MSVIPFESPSTLSCVGSTGSGKSTFVMKLLQQNKEMFVKPPKTILYCYGIFQPLYSEMEASMSNITFYKGLPDSSMFEQLDSREHNLIVLDDLMNEVNNSSEMQRLFCQDSHHCNISVFFVSQNLYFGGKYGKTINLNCHYLTLFKNPNAAQIRILGQQLLPGSSQVLTQAYKDCMKQKYGYLLVDLHPGSDSDLMLRTRIFPGEDTIVYKAKLS